MSNLTVTSHPVASTLGIPPSDLGRPRAVNTSSSSSEVSSRESGTSTPASSIPSSTATSPHPSDTQPGPSYEEPSSSTYGPSYVPSPNQAAQDASTEEAVGPIPTQSHFNPPSIILESSHSSESTASQEENSGGTDDVAGSVPESVTQDPEPSTQFTWSSMVTNRFSRKSWLQHTMGSTMLAATLIGLFIYQRRSYRIALWTAENDFMQSCIGLVQVNHTLSERCKKVIDEGVGEAPYTRRDLYAIGVETHKLTKRIFGAMERGVGPSWNALRIGERTSTSASGVSKATIVAAPSSTVLPTSTQTFGLFRLISWNSLGAVAWNEATQRTWTPLHLTLLFTSAFIILGFLLFWLLFSSRTESSFTSPARAEVQVTRKSSEGAASTCSDGPSKDTWDYPVHNDPPGEIRRRVKQQEDRSDFTERDGYFDNIDSNNSSASTLVGSSTGSETMKVPITTDHDKNHPREFLEYRSNDSTKHYLDLSTGEHIRLSPWTHPSDCDDKDSTAKVKAKHGDVSRVLAMLGAGSAAFSLKQVDEKTFAKEKKKWSKGIKAVKEEGERKLARGKDKSPIGAGDCVTGDITHEAPSVAPTLAL